MIKTYLYKNANGEETSVPYDASEVPEETVRLRRGTASSEIWYLVSPEALSVLED